MTSKRQRGAFRSAIGEQLEQSEREERARSAEERLRKIRGDSAPTAESAPIAESAARSYAPAAESANPRARTLQPSESAADAESALGALVDLARGFTQVPNAALDDVMQHLSPLEQSVYIRIVRLTAGHHRETCTVGADTIATRIKASERSVYSALKRLQYLGLIQKVGTGPSEAGGRHVNVYRLVTHDSRNPAKPAESAVRAHSERRAESAADAVMKETLKETHETAVAEKWEIRQAAARLKEARRTDPTYDRAALVRDLRSSFVAQGREVTVEEIERALDGLAL